MQARPPATRSANGASGGALVERGAPVQRNLPNPGVRGSERRVGGIRAKGGQPLPPSVELPPAAVRPQERRGIREEALPGGGEDGSGGQESVRQKSLPTPNAGAYSSNGRQPGRPPTVNLPQPRVRPGEIMAPADHVESETAAGETDAADEEAFGTLRGPWPLHAPPREQTERERLAMRPEIRGELGGLIDELRTVFEQDRTVAAQASSVRCGICYLYHPAQSVEYREGEGFYVCEQCREALGNKRLPMIRRQNH